MRGVYGRLVVVANLERVHSLTTVQPEAPLRNTQQYPPFDARTCIFVVVGVADFLLCHSETE